MLLHDFTSIFHRRVSRPALLMASLCAFVFIAFAGSVRAQLDTKNNYVEATVDQAGTGYISIYYAGTNQVNKLSYPGHSFFTVEVGNSYYTNNPDLNTNASPKQPAGLLTNGSSQKIQDTIRTIWQPQGASAYDIIQDVYPVEFDRAGSGQIVIRYSVLNHQPTAVSAVPQFLLDLAIQGGYGGSSSFLNDNAPVTTRNGYLEQSWQEYPIGDIPPYFVTTQFSVTSQNFPGLVGAGYLSDSLAPEPMGITGNNVPSLFVFGHWPDLVQGFTWNYPTNPTTPQWTDDDALLLQWPGNTGNQGVVTVIGMFSYGTAACAPFCVGNDNVDAMLIHPDHITWSGPPFYQYNPNRFPVEALIWNAGETDATNVTGTQTITNSQGAQEGPVKIVSPNPPTVPLFSQTHSVVGGAIPHGSSSAIAWADTVLANVLTNCSTDSAYDINLTIQAGGVITTSWKVGCSCPIDVDCEQKDVTPPRHTPWVAVGGTNHCGRNTVFHNSVYDNLSTDLGVQSISVDSIVPSKTYLKVTIPTFSPCDNADSIQVTVTQVDSLHSSCAYLHYTDCAGNTSLDTICFESCPPPIIVDTLSPRIRLISKSNWNNPSGDSSCSFRCSEWVVTDSVNDVPTGGLQRDGGLDSIGVVSSNNMTFTLLHPVKLGMQEDTFTVCVSDTFQDGTITIGAADSAGNPVTSETITFCTVPDTTKPKIFGTNLDPATNSWPIVVTDDTAWDRGVDSVVVTALNNDNCQPVPNASITITQLQDTVWSIHPSEKCSPSVSFTIAIQDTFLAACYEIQATDCAGNQKSNNACSSPPTDHYCPTDTIQQLSADSIRVIFSDYHAGIDYDGGIDSIWFYNARNITMIHGAYVGPPKTIHEPVIGQFPRVYTLLDTVYLYVTNTTDSAVDSVCWNAVDSAQNSLCNSEFCWSAPIAQDSTPPFITTIDACDSIIATIVDTLPLDEGIDSVWLDPTQTANFKSFAVFDSGTRVLSIGLPVIDTTKSARTAISANDVFGTNSHVLSIEQKHTTTANISIYKQDLAMGGSGSIAKFTAARTTIPFQFPIYLIANDTFSLGSKGISECQFTFDLTGSSNVSFLGAKDNVGWNVTVNPAPPAAGPYTVTAIAPSGTPLGDNQITDTLLYLDFSANQTPDVEEASINIVADDCGAQVVYNGGNETLTSGGDYSVALPAPSGRLNSANVFLMDTCATIVGVDLHPQFLSLAPVVPNPVGDAGATNSANVEYTVPASVRSTNNESMSALAGAPVRLELFNALGESVRTVVNALQPQGIYRITLDCSGLKGGLYFLRLESQGQVCSQQVIVTK